MVIACSTYGRQDRCVKGIGGEMDRNHLEDLHLEDLGVDAKILK